MDFFYNYFFCFLFSRFQLFFYSDHRMTTNTNTFQPPVIPKDSEGFVKSFTLSSSDGPEAAEARAFFDEYGFVVIANVFTPEQCAETIADIWDVIESFVKQPVRDNEALWTPQ